MPSHRFLLTSVSRGFRWLFGIARGIHPRRSLTTSSLGLRQLIICDLLPPSQCSSTLRTLHLRNVPAISPFGPACITTLGVGIGAHHLLVILAVGFPVHHAPAHYAAISLTESLFHSRFVQVVAKVDAQCA